jgi:hypothetical protein
MAIVRVECEIAEPLRLLLRVTTVDDVTARTTAPEAAPFDDVDAVLEHLRRWLEQWVDLR